MSTMKRFRPKRSFSTAVGGPGAARRESELVFGASAAAKAARSAIGPGPSVALPGLLPTAAREPVRIDVPKAALEKVPARKGLTVERDDHLPSGKMRVTYADGTSELLPLPKG